jgi:hypothetical protein
MKNVENASRLHLGRLVDELKKGRFVIPDFQRDFEWEPWDVLDLIKSIFLDYYIGTLLLWKGSEKNYGILSCENIYAFKGSPDPQHIVLDGQQRLTAIYYAFFQPNIAFPRRAKPMAYFLDIQVFLDEDENNGEAFWYDSLTKKNIELLENPDLQYKQHIFPLGLMQEGSWGVTDWIKGYRDYWIAQGEKVSESDEDTQKRKILYGQHVKNASVLKETIEDLFDQYYVSFIELDREINIVKVCEIFTQVNSKGVRLDIFDLLNAILRPKEIYLKNLWNDSQESLNYIEPKKMKIYVLQVMSILEQAYCSAKYLYYLVPGAIKTIKKQDGSKEQIELVNSGEDFLIKWNAAIASLKKAIQILKNPRDFGAISPAFIPYPSIIPAFAAIKSYVENSKVTNKLDIKTKIKKWYWASIFTNRYSSSVESTSAKDFQSLKRWFKDNNQEPEVINDFLLSYKNLDLVHENPKGSAIYNAIFNLFIINEARDWSSFDLPEYNALDDHHIVPVSIFREEAGKPINSVLNRTPISPITNRHIINNRMPNEYLKEMLDNNDDKEKVYEVLASHLLSKKAVTILLRDPFEKQDFDEFIHERQKTIIDAIENLLIEEKINLPVALKTLDENIEKVEINLRELILKKIGTSFEQYKEFTPPHIQDTINGRITSDLKKNPYKNSEAFKTFDKKIKFFTLFELCDFLVSKKGWYLFESFFANKEQLRNRFNQISALRNGIRHSRDVSSIEKLDGEAAIEWFNNIL